MDNILLFIPFGFFLSAIEGGGKRVILTGAIVSASIEIIQYIAALGLAEIDDVISNTLGAVIGFGVWRLMRKVVENYKKKLRET